MQQGTGEAVCCRLDFSLWQHSKGRRLVLVTGRSARLTAGKSCCIVCLSLDLSKQSTKKYSRRCHTHSGLCLGG